MKLRYILIAFALVPATHLVLEQAVPPVWKSLPSVVEPSAISRAEAGDASMQKKLGEAYLDRAARNDYPNKRWWERNLASRDRYEALGWLNLSAAQGDLSALNLVARCYREGWGVKRNLNLAETTFAKAERAGYFPAKVDLGINQLIQAEVRSHKRHVGLYHKTSYNLFKQAADLGNPNGQYWLGHMYAKGFHVDKDLDEAERWWRKAAMAGFKEAENRLSILLEQQ